MPLSHYTFKRQHLFLKEITYKQYIFLAISSDRNVCIADGSMSNPHETNFLELNRRQSVNITASNNCACSVENHSAIQNNYLRSNVLGIHFKLYINSSIFLYLVVASRSKIGKWKHGFKMEINEWVAYLSERCFFAGTHRHPLVSLPSWMTIIMRQNRSFCFLEK